METLAGKPFSAIASYNGYSEAAGSIKDMNGNTMTNTMYAKFSRSVSCDAVYVPQQAGTAGATFMRVTVNVTYDGKPMASITRLFSN
jgi:hypothetical protein